jgi:hypothetical protein
MRYRSVGSMAIKQIVMVDMGHGEQDVGMSERRVVRRIIAELVFEHEYQGVHEA